MRALFLTHYYPPELGAAPARIAALARGLTERGVEVTVHTGFPHYPAGAIAAPYRNRPLLRERDGAVRVLRSAVLPAPNRGVVRRLADHAAFALGALATAPAAGPVDVVIAETPPLFTAAAGVCYARVKRAALALNVSDLWPESAVELGALAADGRANAAAAALARSCYRQAAAIAAPTAGIVATLGARPEAHGKVTMVPPAVDLERFSAVAARSPSYAQASGQRPLRVLYAGTLGIAQGLSTLLDAAALAGPRVLELQLAGAGPERERLRAEIATRGLEHVRLLGAVPPEEIPALYGQADAAVVPLRDLPIFNGALPTKLFEALAAGRPAIVAARGEAAALVRDAAAGLAVAPESPAALADAFRQLHASPQRALAMGARGRAHAHRYGRAAAVERWHELLSALVERR